MSPRSALRAPRPTETANEFAADVVSGLTAKPKYLRPKYFYDLTGSGLFDRITTLPEYYPTRARPLDQARAGNRIAVSASLRAG
jgi:L-histidine Nalpha-methyltransferase